ncbi:MAG TPA: glycosyltransferase [Pyrinomonadaceae bacterium]|nr:glycosyltransferase [Pyrinomonadaceae bacterium]
MRDSREPLLFYCQHSLGMGHLVRSLALAASLAERFRVVLLNGGKLPKGLSVPKGVEVVNMPPLGLDFEGRLVSRDGRRTAERAKELRRALVMETYRRLRPRVVLVELFPFGRKKFADELLPLLEEAQKELTRRPLVVCSLRDILVGKRAEQQKHDARAVETANRYFDAVLVHSDPAFARLEESLGTYSELTAPVHYTGFVLPAHEPASDSATKVERQILVSAGGGLVGETLFRAAVNAYTLLRESVDVTMKIVAGPFLPEEAWRRLRELARRVRGLSVRRFVPDLCGEMRRSAASVSQCGYNTALDVLRSGVPALVVPFSDGGEDEQLKRARRLERLGALRVAEQRELDATRLARELRELLKFRPRQSALDMDGARNSTRLIESLLRARTARAGSRGRTTRAAKEAQA